MTKAKKTRRQIHVRKFESTVIRGSYREEPQVQVTAMPKSYIRWDNLKYAVGAR
jgi:hypothetical protein